MRAPKVCDTTEPRRKPSRMDSRYSAQSCGQSRDCARYAVTAAELKKLVKSRCE